LRQPDLDLGLGLERLNDWNRLNDLVAEIFVQQIAQWLSCYEALQIVDEDRQKERPLLLREAADPWANDYVWQIPKLRIGRQWLSRKGIQRRRRSNVLLTPVSAVSLPLLGRL
jgi:hypothetical protein